MKKISSAHIILVFILILQNILSFGILYSNINLPAIPLMILSQLTILLPFIVYCIIKKKNPLELIRFKKISIATVILSVIIAICSYPVVTCLNLLSMLFVENAMVGVMTEVLSKGALLGMMLMAVMPAIVEETIFRGVVYNTYSKRRPLLGVFLSAFLFGLMHMNFNQMPYAFFLGIIMALLMEACDSIIAPMIFHFTLNGGSTLLSFLSLGASDGMEVSQAGDFKSMYIENYKMAMAEAGLEMSEAKINAMFPMLITIMIIVFVVIALAALAGVLALVYAVFRINNRKPSEVFKADHSDTAYIANKKGVMKKNRMIDVPVILFMGYTFVMCILAALG